MEKLLLIVVNCLLVIILGGFLVKVCWNYFMPPIFGTPDVTYAQAIILFILCDFLFCRKSDI